LKFSQDFLYAYAGSLNVKTQFALVDGERREPKRGLSAKCPICENPMVAKCGEKRIHHWAHRQKHTCDHWWENKTEWHRTWQGYFPIEWQEVVHRADDGEKHIADVKTDQDWVLEFQYSHLKPEERQKRETFYKKLVWVVYGTRLEKDKPQFIETLNSGSRFNETPLVLKVFTEKSVLLSEWAECSAPVFFDFGDETIWWLLPKAPDGKREYMVKVTRTGLIERFRGLTTMPQRYEEVLKAYGDLVEQIYRRLSKPQAQSINQFPSPTGFHLYQNRLDRSRRRL
jgi:hypothetical protein